MTSDSHDHHHYRGASRRSLLTVLVLIGAHMAVEMSGGVLSGSLGLMAHAFHMLTDVAAIGIALLAVWIATRPSSVQRTFGFQRAEVLVVMFNALALWLIAGWIFFEAFHRFGGHAHVEGGIMLIAGSVGLGINIIAALTLYRSSRHSITVEGAFWHIMADLMGSVAVVASGALTWLFDWDIVDPIPSMFIVALILVSSSRLVAKVVHILLESTPARLDMYRLCSAIEDIEGVTLIHDVHAWTITSGYEAFTAHVLVEADYPAEQMEPLLRRVRQIAYQDFGIRHVTIQMEQLVAGCAEENHHVGHLAARSRTES